MRPLALLRTHLLGLGRQADLLLIGLFVAIIALMVLPLPGWLLDALIATNLTVSVIVLVVAVYIRTPLGLSTFPALLLFTTLFRLALNIASTRQILLTGHAGEIIQTFGHLVVGGDVVVGLVVFLIIALVQFIVIAKGSERIAEVGARFSLDAMPGKQMSIDADLRAGLISKDEARARRQALESESQLYGSMDGAMKFVKGDAIAALVIAAVNIVGGISIGILRKDMSFSGATQLYSVLAVGDALVSQIPSLFMSVAAGIVVTRVAQDERRRQDNLASDIAAQVAAHPRALMISGGVISSMALVPGLPAAQFLLLGAAVCGAGWWARPTSKRRREGQMGLALTAFAREGSSMAPLYGEECARLWSAPLAVRLPRALLPHLDAEQLDGAMAAERRQLTSEWGLPFPGVQLLPCDAAGLLAIDVHGVPVLQLQVDGPRCLALGAAPAGSEAGPDLFGQPTRWVDKDEAVDSLSMEKWLALAVRRCVSDRPDRFMDVQAALTLTQELEASHPEMESELRQMVPLPRLAEVCRMLLAEGISLSDLTGLAQALIDHAGREKDSVALVDKVRVSLSEQVTDRFVERLASDHASAGTLRAVLLAPQLEDQLAASVRVSNKGHQLVVPLAFRSGFLAQVEQLQWNQWRQQFKREAVLLVHRAELRPALRSFLLSAGLGRVPVLCADELVPDVQVTVLADVSLEMASPELRGALPT
jgi:type III secretion protein V